MRYFMAESLVETTTAMPLGLFAVFTKCFLTFSFPYTARSLFGDVRELSVPDIIRFSKQKSDFEIAKRNPNRKL